MSIFSVRSLMNEEETVEYNNYLLIISESEKEVERIKSKIETCREWVYSKNKELHDRFIKSLINENKPQ